jgi:hypothetical protein
MPKSVSFTKLFSLLKSVPIVSALGIVVLANIALLLFNPADQFKIDVEKLPSARTWAWWGAQDFLHQDKAPDVVLMGSSVMMQGSWFQEAQFRNAPVELITDHRSKYLENLLEHKAGLNTRCFNFALPGSMSSDICMTAKAMLRDPRKPAIAVIGLTPRDMIDNTFHCPAGTKHYQYMSKFVDTSQLQDIAVPRLSDRPRYWFQQNCYFNSKAKMLTTSIGEVMRQKMMASGVNPSPLDKVAESDRRFALFKNELERGFWIAYPNNPYAFVDATYDCVRRLKKTNDEMFENQCAWLQLTIDHLKAENITPVLVCMPVSPVAIQTMPPITYARHVQKLQEISDKAQCRFVDLNTLNTYVLTDFSDWAHLNASGGKKLLDGIATVITQDPRLCSKLTEHTKSLAMHGTTN